nr:MAG TPA_asm: hypothetical protein [Caudoviricetes sp.]
MGGGRTKQAVGPFFISSLSSFFVKLPPYVPASGARHHPTSHLSQSALLPCSGQLAALPLAQRAGLIRKEK